jgi:hypothetical protein
VTGKLEEWIPKSGFQAVYRNVVSDLTSSSRLGRLHDVISSTVRVDRNTSTFYEKEEGKKFRTVESHWKIPM